MNSLTEAVDSRQLAGQHLIDRVAVLSKDYFVNQREILQCISRMNVAAHARASRIRVVIPAAGKATRLGGHNAKTLIALDGEPILFRTLRMVVCFDPRPIIVVNPINHHMIRRAVELAGFQADYVVQHRQLGMADAIRVCEAKVSDADTIVVIWGDMAKPNFQSLQICTALYSALGEYPSVVMPTVVRQDPYIAIERDEKGYLCGVRQQRAGDSMPSMGESDCGVFVLRRSHLFQTLREGSLRDVSNELARQNAGLDFLPVINRMGRHGGVICVNCASELESRSINTFQDLDFFVAE